MRKALAFALGALLGCGQVAPADSTGPGPSTPDTAPAPSPPPPAPASPAVERAPDIQGWSTAPAARPAGYACQSGVTQEHVFTNATELAVALQGLWVSCAGAPTPSVCPEGDTSMYFGSFESPDPSSRVASCGHLSAHGSGFIANPQYVFTYEIKAATAGTGAYTFHLWNAIIDREFALSYRDDGTASPSAFERTLVLADATEWGALQHGAFTTF